jgi:phosphoglycerate kinase
MRYVQEYNFKGKKALIRVDFNVPLNDHFGVVDDTRIQGAIPTIRKVLDEGGGAVLLSHLGRPQQGYEERFSLQHLVPYLSRILGTQVAFEPSCVGLDTQAKVQHPGPGKVLLLENVRFQAGETMGNPGLAQALAAWGDVYINDAFSTAHRAHTSTTLLAHYFQDKLAGYLIQKELNSADKILKRAKKPFVAIIGGAKISDKIQPLERLLDHLDYLLVGGGVANTFQRALGGQIGASLLESDQVELARRVVQKAQKKEVQLVLPADVVVSPRLEEVAEKRIVAGGAVPTGWMALDIGPKARQEFANIVQAAQTILWCGPLGVFEMPSFQQGTQAVAAAVAQATKQGAFSLVGGGDSAAAIKNLGYADQVSHLSTGGGALLAYLGGVPLPGVIALNPFSTR